MVLCMLRFRQLVYQSVVVNGYIGCAGGEELIDANGAGHSMVEIGK